MDVMRLRCVGQQAGDGGAAQRGLEGVVAASGNGDLQQRAALLPGGGHRFIAVDRRQRRDQLARITVRIEPVEPFTPQAGAEQGALAGTVDAGQHQDEGAPARCAQADTINRRGRLSVRHLSICRGAICCEWRAGCQAGRAHRAAAVRRDVH